LTIEYENQKAKLTIPKNISDVAISLSGGLDSTLLTYITALKISKTGQNTKVHTLSGNDTIRPSRDVTLKIRNWIESKFDINWGEHFTWDNTKNSTIHKKQMDGRAIKEFCLSRNVNFILNGKTANPPMDVIEMFNSSHYEKDRQHDRNEQNVTLHEYGILYRPWINVDKKIICYGYKKYDIFELADMTWSCIGYEDQTENFTTPCKKCYWCNERTWGWHGIRE